MTNQYDERAIAVLDTLAERLPETRPDLTGLLAGARRRRRRRRLGTVVAMVAVVLIAGGVVAQQVGAPDDTLVADATGTGGDDPVGESTTTKEGDGSTSGPTVEIFTPGTLVAPIRGTSACHVPIGFNELTVPAPTGVADAENALEALFNHQVASSPPHPMGGFVREDGRAYDVRAVTHTDGVVTVDVDLDLWDPFPSTDLVCRPDGGMVMQQIVRTAQTALDTTDPVLLTINGEPAEGIWGHPLEGPVPAGLAEAGLLQPVDPEDFLDEGAVPLTECPEAMAYLQQPDVREFYIREFGYAADPERTFFHGCPDIVTLEERYDEARKRVLGD